MTARGHWHRNDYVRLRMAEPFDYDVYVVASDYVALYGLHETECWIIAVHDNDWDQVGTHVSTHFVDLYQAELLYRDPAEAEGCCSPE